MVSLSGTVKEIDLPTPPFPPTVPRATEELAVKLTESAADDVSVTVLAIPPPAPRDWARKPIEASPKVETFPEKEEVIEPPEPPEPPVVTFPDEPKEKSESAEEADVEALEM